VTSPSDPSEFYGIGPEEVPGFVQIGEEFVPEDELPEDIREWMATMMGTMRSLHREQPVVFEAVVNFISLRIAEVYGEVSDPD
jgi:hypothetical protein